MVTRPIAKKYCEGKVKRTLKRGSKALEIVIRKTYTAGDWGRGVQWSGVCRRLVVCRKAANVWLVSSGLFLSSGNVSTRAWGGRIRGGQGALGGSLSGV
jgi:hypothetical protein